MNRKAFTLIELLVVVLIIGILAAIALPMYTKTVEKSRAVNAVVWLKTAADSTQRLYMENANDDICIGDCSADENKYEQLDIQPAENVKGFTCSIGNHCGDFCEQFPYCSSQTHGYNLIVDVSEDGQVVGPYCTADSEAEEGVKMCKMLGFTADKENDDTMATCPGSSNFSGDKCWFKP